jgi:hypothetical protein
MIRMLSRDSGGEAWDDTGKANIPAAKSVPSSFTDLTLGLLLRCTTLSPAPKIRTIPVVDSRPDITRQRLTHAV